MLSLRANILPTCLAKGVRSGFPVISGNSDRLSQSDRHPAALQVPKSMFQAVAALLRMAIVKDDRNIHSGQVIDEKEQHMTIPPMNPAPPDADERRAVEPVTVYSVDKVPTYNREFYDAAREGATLVEQVVISPRDARCLEIPAGHLFRIICTEGPQVGDLNLWNARDLRETFYSGKTRALHATHVSTGDRLWSCMPWLRPMATITHDTLDWYGFDAFGAGVHDVIGTRCDPYTNYLLTGEDYHYCCHSTLTRALATAEEAAPGRSRGACPRCRQCLHVHRLPARYQPVLHEGESGTGRRFP